MKIVCVRLIVIVSVFAAPIFLFAQSRDPVEGCLVEKATVRTGGGKIGIFFSPDGRYVTQGGTRELRIWDVETGRLVRQFQGKERSGWPVAFSPDGSFIAAATRGNDIQIWETSSGRLLQLLKTGYGDLTSLTFSPNGKRIAAAGSDETLLGLSKGESASKVWQVASGELIGSLNPDRLAAKSVIFSYVLFGPDSDSVISSFENQVAVWNAATGRPMTYLSGPDQKSSEERVNSVGSIIGSMARSSDGSVVATIPFYDGPTILWRVPSEEPFLNTGQNANSADFSPDNRFVVLGGKDKTARVWDIEEKRQVKQLEGHNRSIRSVSFSSDGRFLLTSDSDTTLVWRIADWKIVAKIPKGGFGAFSPAGNILATSRTRGRSDEITLWALSQNCVR